MVSLKLPEPHEVAVDDIAPAIAQLASLQGALAARLIMERRQATPASDDDMLLTAEEACKLIKMKKTWLYSHAKNLPFTRHTGSRTIRFSRKGILSWLGRRR